MSENFFCKPSLRTCIYLSVLFFLISFSAEIFAADHAWSFMFTKSGNAHALINDYYKLRENSPVEAKMILEGAAKKHPEDALIQTELAYLYLKEKQLTNALNQFKLAYKLNPNDTIIAQQIDYLTQTLNDKATDIQFQQNKEAASVLKNYDEKLSAILYVNWTKSLNLMNETAITSSMVIPATLKNKTNKAVKIKVRHLKAIPISENSLLNAYYNVKKKDLTKAKLILQKLISRYPNNITAQKEMGYLLIAEKQNAVAVKYFIKAYSLNPKDDYVAAQVGYLLDALDQHKQAYYYFENSFKSREKTLRDKSYQALVVLAPYAHKIIPDPYFIDLYASPLYYSRFDLLITPMWLRAGRTFGKAQQLEVYFNFMFNKDNRSGDHDVNSLPNIFEDNYLIYGVGVRYKPFIKIPVVAYAELGLAYDLLPRNRARWQNDFRTGLLSYYNWSTLAPYADSFRLPFTQVGDVYSSAVYYTRYHDVIADARIREGFKALQYKEFSVDLYGRVFAITDSKHYFYNNLYEYGPGIAIIPFARWPLIIRLERRYGNYIKVNSPDPNPYGSHYSSNTVMVEFSSRF